MGTPFQFFAILRKYYVACQVKSETKKQDGKIGAFVNKQIAYFTPSTGTSSPEGERLSSPTRWNAYFRLPVLANIRQVRS
jgi:hypothetical protein